ncbi:MAG: ferritin-like domain-containing protein [Xanthomonadales bacterium]|nr:ferritin-like domain-containing protein [Xanthomonadales bacterium]
MALHTLVERGDVQVEVGAELESLDEPGRPDRPVLVSPRELKPRGLGSAAGRAALVHAVAHIEFNAINLACDAVVRFAGMPESFYLDWASVAVDEARHFAMLADRLGQMEQAYGDMPAHDGLWDMARRTAHDVLVRMALVPRVLEARGLDVTPDMIAKLRHAGDLDTVACLEVILEEEVRHVEIGSRWFAWACAARGLEPETTFLGLVETHARAIIRPPINDLARSRAGFTAQEIAWLRTC